MAGGRIHESGVTGQITCVQCDSTPSHAFHVRHLCTFVDARGMMDLLSKIVKTPVGVRCPGRPVLTLDRAMQMPLR
jgi:hypothetical protein